MEAWLGREPGGGCRRGDKKAANPLRPGAELRCPSAQLAERGGRATRDHGQGWHGAVARPASTGDGSLGGHRRRRGPSPGPAGTEGGGLCPHRGQHRGKAIPAEQVALGGVVSAGVGSGWGRGSGWSQAVRLPSLTRHPRAICNGLRGLVGVAFLIPEGRSTFAF